MLRKPFVAFATVLGLVAPASGDRSESGVADVTVIENGEGAARVLFRCPPVHAAEGLAVRRATLTLSITGPSEARTVHLQVHPVTREWDPRTVSWESGWSRPGGDFDDELYARTRVALDRGATTAHLDVTSLVKEIVESGFVVDGFILTVAPRDGEGIRTEDLSRLEGLTGATFDLMYRAVPTIPRGEG